MLENLRISTLPLKHTVYRHADALFAFLPVFRGGVSDIPSHTSATPTGASCWDLLTNADLRSVLMFTSCMSNTVLCQTKELMIKAGSWFVPIRYSVVVQPRHLLRLHDLRHLKSVLIHRSSGEWVFGEYAAGVGVYGTFMPMIIKNWMKLVF